MSTAPGLPDLLHRFVPTPYRFCAQLNSTVINFETNDQELLMIFEANAGQLAGILAHPPRLWLWKLVRDHDVSHEAFEPYLLAGEGLSTLFLGRGTMATLDWRRGELLGFVASNTPARDLLDALVEIAQQQRLHPVG